jgi:hypothetical protein
LFDHQQYAGAGSGDDFARFAIKAVTGRGPFGDTATHADHVVDTLLIEETANLRRTAAGAAVDNDLPGRLGKKRSFRGTINPATKIVKE